MMTAPLPVSIPGLLRHADHGPEIAACRPAGHGLCQPAPPGAKLVPWREALTPRRAPSAAVCRECGKPRTRRTTGRAKGYRGAHGWCQTCSNRWYAAGKPETGVPPRLTAEEHNARNAAAREAAHLGRIEDYDHLRRTGSTRAEAAARVGVRVKTTYSYDRLIADGILGTLW